MSYRVPISFLTILLLCAAAGSSTPAAVASPASREARRAANEIRRAAHEAKRDALRAHRAALRSEREERRATRVAEREERKATRTAEREARKSGGGEGDGAKEGPPLEGVAPPLPGEPAPVKTGNGGACTLTAAASAARITTGEAVTISGKLSCPTAESASAQEVTLYQHEAGAASAVPAVVATATTSSDGSYEFHTAALGERSAFVVRTASARHQARVVVLVDADVSLQGTAASGSTLAIAGGGASGANDRLRFSGAVKPSADATLIELRVQQSGADWRTVAFARTDAEGNYSFSHRFRYAGNVSVMAVAHVRHEHITGSPPLTYTITQAQNPALTIQATAPSPAPITTTAGVPVSSSTPATTINGIVLGGHDQSVVLLARPLGTSRFAPVASTRADATGAYTFTVDPTATTLYKVRFGSTRSTVVRVAAG